MNSFSYFIEPALILIGVTFVIAWLLKILLYAFGDSYETGFGSYGGLIMGTFIMYKSDEIEEAEKESSKLRMRINNICGWILAVIAGSALLALLYLALFR